MLLAQKCGIGIGETMPGAWNAVVWRGRGTPDDDDVAHLRGCIMAGSPLPGPDELATSDTLEASALQALDELAPLRRACILHADLMTQSCFHRLLEVRRSR